MTWYPVGVPAVPVTFDPDEPDYPDTAYVVLSIKQGKFSRAAAFLWDNATRDFAEAELIQT